MKKVTRLEKNLRALEQYIDAAVGGKEYNLDIFDMLKAGVYARFEKSKFVITQRAAEQELKEKEQLRLTK